MTTLRCWSLAVAAILSLHSSVQAAFHFMQIEQVIGGVNGDASSQAIQLRMRAAGQSFVSLASLWAADENGANRVLLLDIGSNAASGTAGAHVLLTTSGFTQALINGGNASFAPDFTLANPIPAAYLDAGRLTFEADGGSVAAPGTIYWSLSWGGDNYTGPTSGDFTNDSNGNFGPSFPSSLPTTTNGGLIFTGTAAASSTTNLADYALSTAPTTVTKNSGTAFTLPALPVAGDYDGDHQVTIADYNRWKSAYGSTVAAGTGADGNGDTLVDAADYTVWRNNLNQAGGGQSAGVGSAEIVVPEPATTLSLVGVSLFWTIAAARRRRSGRWREGGSEFGGAGSVKNRPRNRLNARRRLRGVRP